MPDTGGELGLPPLFRIGEFEGSVNEYVEALHWQYRAMLDHADLRLWGKPVTASGRPAADGRDARFWHLITAKSQPQTEETRCLNLKRCAHLPRVWHLLELLATSDVRAVWWREGPYLFVAPADFSMVIVLLETRGSFQLRAAFPTDKRKKTTRLFNRAARAWADGPCAHPTPSHRKWADGCPWIDRLSARQTLIMRAQV
jgi:hypothetical protein